MTPNSENSGPASCALHVKHQGWIDTGIDWQAQTALVLPRTLELAAAEGSRITDVPVGEVCFVLTNDTDIKDLNRDWRGKDTPTNVLSFPAAAEDDGEEDEDYVLGDIVLAFETIAREAQDQGKSFRNHAVHLAVHGILHLLGYDHQASEEAGQMEALERTMLRELEIADPYADLPADKVVAITGES